MCLQKSFYLKGRNQQPATNQIAKLWTEKQTSKREPIKIKFHEIHSKSRSNKSYHRVRQLINLWHKRSKTWPKRAIIPALQDVGGSFCKSLSSFKIRFEAMIASTDEMKLKLERLDLQNCVNIHFQQLNLRIQGPSFTGKK